MHHIHKEIRNTRCDILHYKDQIIREGPDGEIRACRCRTPMQIKVNKGKMKGVGLALQ